MLKISVFILGAFLMLMECETKNITGANECPNVKTSLFPVRKRRHLTFPDNSNMVTNWGINDTNEYSMVYDDDYNESIILCEIFQHSLILTISLVKAFMTHAPSGWNIALEIDVMYPLPDAKFTNAHFRRKLHHRQRRQFWERMESAFDFHNLNGRACILRSICEANEILEPPGRSLVHDILRAIFTIPDNDEELKNEMRGYYDELATKDFCEMSNDCPISLLHFVLSLNQGSNY